MKKKPKKNPFVILNPEIAPVGGEKTAAQATVQPKAVSAMNETPIQPDAPEEKESALSVLKRVAAPEISTGFASHGAAARTLKAHLKPTSSPHTLQGLGDKEAVHDIPAGVHTYGLPQPTEYGPPSMEQPVNPLLYDRLKHMVSRKF